MGTRVTQVAYLDAIARLPRSAAPRGSTHAAAGRHPALHPGKPFRHHFPRDKLPDRPVRERGRQRERGRTWGVGG